ncbi:SRPBCC family protein [Frankia sp. CNm7]|uniref:SRPBCC family protein n=1 Tax=Frankia nepalensis TaxID=1836974 RepID=A0A937UVC4_9ACTN|nr:SRPBCC family protein [Frankia nepalensis]MBL7499161.1 SRPBCC family protein [Frankia nepalensis]MBL7511021.1 SRPBCC family protein [Frankia nepalensis]MBL7520511.1 SRPBCC family protein [Frankia nepalensis]MBL7632101.1 SRPBCC family protein [Frankia nepalensis]
MQVATVSIDETFPVQSPPEAAWRLLTDPTVVVRCMPGAEIVEERADGSLLGALKVKLGPTVVAFSGEVTPSFDEVERQGSIAAHGADSQGRTRAKANTRFTVTPREGFGTSVSLTGTIEVAGPLAPFARTGGAHLARRMVADFSANLSAYIENAVQAADEPDGQADDQAPPLSRPPAAAPVSGLRLLFSTFLDMLRSGLTRLRGLVTRPARRKDRS